VIVQAQNLQVDVVLREIMDKVRVVTTSRNELIDITVQIQAVVSCSEVQSGIVVVYSPHTTGAITVNENADPDVQRDMSSFMEELVPCKSSFRHMEGNSDSHIKGSLFNFNQTFIIENGQIQLGIWQGIYFAEFDGPRTREVWVKVL